MGGTTVYVLGYFYTVAYWKTSLYDESKGGLFPVIYLAEGNGSWQNRIGE